MLRNIKIAYCLAILRFSWFWLGIWVFFYLRFTNYAGIGLIETFLMVSTTVMEIPTGAIADLLGRKNTLIVGTFLQSACQIIMALAQNLPMLLVSVSFGGIGGALCSGTDQALIYDTLKENNQEKSFDKVITNINTLTKISIGFSGLVGGWLYLQNPTFPFWFSGIGYLLALILTFFMIEPKIDSEKFSWNNYVQQNKAGFRQLFNSPTTKRLTISLLVTGGVLIIFYEMLNDVLAVEFGFNPISLSILSTIVFLSSALISQLSPKINKKLPGMKGIMITTILIAVTCLVSPFAGLLLSGLSIAFRMFLFTTYENLSAITLNPAIESKYRATTISTFNMIKNLPCVFSAFLLGRLMDIITAKNFALILGIVLLTFVGYSILSTKMKGTKFR